MSYVTCSILCRVLCGRQWSMFDTIKPGLVIFISLLWVDFYYNLLLHAAFSWNRPAWLRPTGQSWSGQICFTKFSYSPTCLHFFFHSLPFYALLSVMVKRAWHFMFYFPPKKAYWNISRTDWLAIPRYQRRNVLFLFFYSSSSFSLRLLEEGKMK